MAKKRDSKIVHAGRHPEDYHGAVNTPVYRFSTITFNTVAELKAASKGRYDSPHYYGRFGTPTTFAFEEAVAELEGGVKAVATCSGVAAIASALLTVLESGDHLLMVDSAYHPTRKFCEVYLKKFGVETTFYDPLAAGNIKELIRDNTKVVFCESPGSLTFEVQDIPAIAKAAHDAGAVVMLDNTWATPLLSRPFELGVDISIQAATKYIVGHSDAMLGAVILKDETWYQPLRELCATYGYSTGSEEAFLGLRGLRTLGVRLRQHEATGLKLAHWLKDRPEVSRVLHPALEDDPGHDIWQRDFNGACGLFGVVLDGKYDDAAVAAMLDSLELFPMGYSWGGYESLILPTTGAVIRTATPWEPEGQSLRLHAGLEDVDDLIADLEQGFENLNSNS